MLIGVQGAVAAAGGDEDDVDAGALALPEDIQYSVLSTRRTGATRSEKALPALAALRLPDRPVVS